tara:strand:- start:1273 stop:2115 length:843 start_codon:yes stop_codon:yes gene_type:complete
MAEIETAWSVLSKIDVSEHVEKKNNLTYLSWAWAWGILKDKYPQATFEKHWFDHACGRLPYATDPAGNTFVSVTVTIGDDAMTEVMPVLNHANKSVKNPDAFQVNTSLQRALAKAIGLHGLGAYIYQGEDLPPEEKGKEDIPSFDEDAAKIEQPTPVAAKPKKDDAAAKMSLEDWRKGLLGHPESPVIKDGDTISIADPANSEGADLVLKTFSTFMPRISDHKNGKECVTALNNFYRVNKDAVLALREIDPKHEATVLGFFKAAKAAANNGDVWQVEEKD